jgi:hypothetical protein
MEPICLLNICRVLAAVNVKSGLAKRVLSTLFFLSVINMMPHEFTSPMVFTKARVMFLISLFSAVWIMTHPYLGIWHDGNLYLGQALFHISPDLYRQDLFFKFGSQDQFTLFSPIYAWAIKQFGLSIAPIGMMLIGQCLFAAALLLFCVELFGLEIGFWSACAVALVTHAYGGLNIFSYSETFLTARTFAEPLCLVGLYFLLKSKDKIALGALLFAALIHPLTALPCLVIWWIYQIRKDKRWMALSGGVLLLPILAFSNIEPFCKFFQTYDPAWWQSVELVNAHVIPLKWTAANWCAFGFDNVMILFGLRFIDEKERRFFSTVLLVGVAGVLLSIFATSVFRNVLLTSIQLWRAHWILHLVAVSAIPYVVFTLWPLRGVVRFAAVLVLLAGYLLPYPAALMAISLAILLYHQRKREIILSPITKMTFWSGVCLMVMIKSGFKILPLFEVDPVVTLMSMSWSQKIVKSIFAFPVVLLSVLALGRLSKGGVYHRRIAYLGVLLLALLSFYFWDQRTPWQRYLEKDHLEVHPFQQYLTRGGETYWYDQVLAPWVLLKVPSYFDSSQGAGLLFNRGTGMEFARRNKALEVLQFQITICKMTDLLNNNHECRPSMDVVRETCESSPNLDVMVLPWQVQGMNYIKWSVLLPGAKNETNYYLYRCEKFRKRE